MKTAKTREFDAARFLKDEATIAEYLAVTLETPDPELFLRALGHVARARGMAQLAKDSGVGRESLYKLFAECKKPQFETILKITRALGLAMDFRPAKTVRPRPS